MQVRYSRYNPSQAQHPTTKLMNPFYYNEETSPMSPDLYKPKGSLIVTISFLELLAFHETG
jgi:hypothetical protein